MEGVLICSSWFMVTGLHCFKRQTEKKTKPNQQTSLGLKHFVCVVVCSACQDIHGHQSQAGELIKYINVCV